MAREPMTERLPQLRVTKRVARWVRGEAKRRNLNEADIQREALEREMERAYRVVPSSCSCSPDDRRDHGCTCGAEVAR